MMKENSCRDTLGRFLQAGIDKDEASLRRILVATAKLQHMTGVVQTKEEYIEAIKDNTLNYYEYEVLEFARIDEEWFNVKVRILGKVYGSGKSWQTVPMKFRFVQDGIDNIRLAYIGVDLGV